MSEEAIYATLNENTLLEGDSAGGLVGFDPEFAGVVDVVAGIVSGTDIFGASAIDGGVGDSLLTCDTPGVAWRRAGGT
jgi:hypothetical protein